MGEKRPRDGHAGSRFWRVCRARAGNEGLIHLSEMSWAKKVRKPSDILKPGDTVEAVILGVNAARSRISLGLKQALGDPWAEVAEPPQAGLGDRRAGHELHQVRRFRSSSRRRRGHDPRKRNQGRKARSTPAGRAEGRPNRQSPGARSRPGEAAIAPEHQADDSRLARRVHRRT